MPGSTYLYTWYHLGPSKLLSCLVLEPHYAAPPLSSRLMDDKTKNEKKKKLKTAYTRFKAALVDQRFTGPGLCKPKMMAFRYI